MWSLLCIPPLAAMIISDLRSRRIGIVHLIIFGITLLTASLLEFGWCQVLVNLSFNLLTVLLLWMSLYGYSSMRKRRFVDEQVEEEALFGGIVDKMKVAGEGALPFMDARLGKR